MRTTTLVSLLAGLLVTSGCLQKGQPVIAERSPVFDPDTAVFAPDEEAQASRERRPASPPAGKPPASYLVQPGDTLYSIAWRFELDYKFVARANRIAYPYTIFPGQRLRLYLPPGVSTRRPPTQLAAPKEPKSNPSQAPAISTGKWVWPVQARMARSFGGSSKGIDFSIGPGSRKPVIAANSGQVVYAGNGIGGYERLIIIRHGASLLSAYSFNGAHRIAEQQLVKAGQKIADIKVTGRTSQYLHFELREDGNPVDPRRFIN